eukprot:1156390-Pelagomonas_calceolata.AAC.10
MLTNVESMWTPRAHVFLTFNLNIINDMSLAVLHMDVSLEQYPFLSSHLWLACILAGQPGGVQLAFLGYIATGTHLL